MAVAVVDKMVLGGIMSLGGIMAAVEMVNVVEIAETVDTAVVVVLVWRVFVWVIFLRNRVLVARYHSGTLVQHLVRGWWSRHCMILFTNSVF